MYHSFTAVPGTATFCNADIDCDIVWFLGCSSEADVCLTWHESNSSTCTAYKSLAFFNSTSDYQVLLHTVKHEILAGVVFGGFAIFALFQRLAYIKLADFNLADQLSQ